MSELETVVEGAATAKFKAEFLVFSILLGVVLWLGSCVVSWHEGASKQENADKVSWQKRLDTSQAALDKANADADAKTKSMQDAIAQANIYSQKVADENAADKKSLADYAATAHSLRVDLKSCRSSAPAATSSGQQSGDSSSAQTGASGMVSDAVANRLESLRLEHNQVIRQLIVAQSVILAYQGKQPLMADAGPLPAP